jgi:hypothetical protein
MRDDRNRNGLTDEERRRIAGCAFSAAVVAAPFIALLYSQTIGLAVLAVALATTLVFAVDAWQHATGGDRERLLALSLIDAGFLALVVIALVWVLMG